MLSLPPNHHDVVGLVNAEQAHSWGSAQFRHQLPGLTKPAHISSAIADHNVVAVQHLQVSGLKLEAESINTSSFPNLMLHNNVVFS